MILIQSLSQIWKMRRKSTSSALIILMPHFCGSLPHPSTPSTGLPFESTTTSPWGFQSWKREGFRSAVTVKFFNVFSSKAYISGRCAPHTIVPNTVGHGRAISPNQDQLRPNDEVRPWKKPRCYQNSPDYPIGESLLALKMWPYFVGEPDQHLPGHLELAVSPVVELVISQLPSFAPNWHSVYVRIDGAGDKDGEQEEDGREHVALLESEEREGGHQVGRWGRATRQER